MVDQIYQSSPEELLASIIGNPWLINAAIEQLDVEDHIKFKHYKPNNKQLEFHSTGINAKERLFMAANRCGKSMGVSLEGCAHLTGNYPDWWNGHRYDRPISMWSAGVADKELKQLKQYYIGDITKPGFIHPSLIIKKNENEHSYYIRHASGGISTLRFKTYKQGEGAWQAEKVDLIHLDEEPPQKIYSEAITRTATVAVGDHGMIMLSMTPLMGMTSLMLKFMQLVVCNDAGEEIEARQVPAGEVNNAKVFIHATHADADHIPEEEKQRLFNSYSPHEREARTKGIPSLGSGLIYPVLESTILCSPFEIPEHWPRCFGMDFGWHNTAAVFMAHDQDNDVAYLYGEYLAGHLTPQHHAFQLIKQGADWMPGGYDHAGEGANQDDGGNVVDLYQQAGIRNWVPADKRSVNKGIYTVLQRMETGKLKIFNTLNKLMTELRMYSRDDNGKVKKGNDHLMDAMRYGIVTGLPIARVKRSTMNKYKIPQINSQNGSNGSWMRV